jgi:hypothetical protein
MPNDSPELLYQFNHLIAVDVIVLIFTNIRKIKQYLIFLSLINSVFEHLFPSADYISLFASFGITFTYSSIIFILCICFYFIDLQKLLY